MGLLALGYEYIVVDDCPFGCTAEPDVESMLTRASESPKWALVQGIPTEVFESCRLVMWCLMQATSV